MIIRPPLAATADVVVVGSGTAGASAAIAAARTGASVVLIEKQGFMGGTSTAVLDTFYGFYTPGSRSRKIAGGVSDDVIAGLRTLGPVVERPNTYGAGTGVTYNSEHLKLVWEALARDAGVRVLLHSFLQDAIVDDGRVESLLVATKAGLARVDGRLFVDASGDADLVFHAGFGFELAGLNDPAQTLTTTFKMVNVDLAARKRISTTEMHELMAEAADSAEYDLPRREGSDHITPIEGMIATVMTRLPSFGSRDGRVVNATDPELLAEAEMAGRRQAVEYARFLHDRVPGYEHASLVALSTQIGVRETRRVYGDYRLTRRTSWAHAASTTRSDSVVRPSRTTTPVPTPSGSTCPTARSSASPIARCWCVTPSNTLVAGRCFSATHDAHASVRSMAQTMAMGQAAGTAAALAVAAAADPRDVSTAALRDRLRQDGAVLELPA